MKRFYAINLIAFCAFVLFVDDNSVTEAHVLRNYFRNLLGPLKDLKTLRHGILPGTLWCGWGDIARDESELGVRREMDICCRAHDLCEDYINPISEKYGLYNRHICRSSLCECELQFYNCLKQVHGFYAAAVGRIYFGKCRQCFHTYYNVEECVREGLDVKEEKDPQDRSVFCAKFDRNLKWWKRHNATLPKSISIPDFSNRIDNELDQPTLPSYFANDDIYFEDDYYTEQ